MPYIPLKKKITLVRNRTEHLFSVRETERSLAASQRLDLLIYHVLLIRRGNFCCKARKISAKRKPKRPVSTAAS